MGSMNNTNKMSVAVMGSGAFGTALAIAIAKAGHDVRLWGYEKSVCQVIQDTRYNHVYLPGIMVPEVIVVDHSMAHVLSGTGWVVMATPVKHMRSLLNTMHPFITQDHMFLHGAKGIERDTYLFPRDIVRDVVGVSDDQSVLVSGPSFARYLALGEPTGLTIAASNQRAGFLAQQLFISSGVRFEPTDDVIGVQLLAVLKNIVAIGCGMVRGAGYGDNTVALFFTVVVREIERLIVSFGGKIETVYGFAGCGDLVLTCYGTQSKNSAWGYQLIAGNDPLGTLLRHEPEGVNSAHAIAHLIEHDRDQYPILMHIVVMILQRPLSPDAMKLFMQLL